MVQIPQPSESEATTQSIRDIRQDLTFGFRYLLKHRSLLAILGFLLVNNFIDSFNYVPQVYGCDYQWLLFSFSQ